jgi:predicted RNA-binding Zn ribbon-like protein
MTWPPRWLFISGRLAIDFVHTGGEGWRSRWERWHRPADLAEWMQVCPLLAVRARVTERDVVAARALREAIWDAAQSTLRGEPISRGAIRALEAAAAGPDLVPVLRGGSRAWAADATGAQALSTVARDAIELFGTGARSRLRQCSGDSCYLLFVDTSRPGKRTWCTMRRCGNLEKIARYRAGLRAETGTRRQAARRGET